VSSQSRPSRRTRCSGDQLADSRLLTVVYGYRPEVLRTEAGKPDLRFFVEVTAEDRGAQRTSGVEMTAVATGAGLHPRRVFHDHKAHITAGAVVLAVAVPVLIFLVLLHALYYYLVRRFQAFDAPLMITSGAVAMLSVVTAWLGVSSGACLVILMLAQR
jgi:hypothetical protein